MEQGGDGRSREERVRIERDGRSRWGAWGLGLREVREAGRLFSFVYFTGVWMESWCLCP